MKLSTIRRAAMFTCMGVCAYTKFGRPWHLKWGATEEEAKAVLPGDEFAPDPQIEATHAITIDAAPEDVWPWIVQLGQNKGGFYSYRWIENLAGCHMPDVREVVQEWQDLKVGDKVSLHPKVALEVRSPRAGAHAGAGAGLELPPAPAGRRATYAVDRAKPRLLREPQPRRWRAGEV